MYLGADKFGYQTITFVEEYMRSRGIEYANQGVKSENEDLKLEDLIPRVTSQVLKNNNNKGILSCGTGIGVMVGANKLRGIRACLATNERIAEWAVVYDRCNILCLSGWNSNKEDIFKIVDSFLNAQYDGDQDRLHMMDIFDTWR